MVIDPEDSVVNQLYNISVLFVLIFQREDSKN